MSRRVVTISIVAILTGLLAFAYIYFTSLQNFKNNQAIKAIPTDASIILQIQNPDKVIDLIMNDVNYNNTLLPFDFFYSFSKYLNVLQNDSIINNTVVKQFKNKPLNISLHSIGKTNVYPLFIYSLNNKVEQNEIINFIEENNIGWQIEKRKYNTSFIYSLKLNKEQPKFHLCAYKGLLLLSNSSLLIENSLRQLRTEFSLMEDATFQKLFKTSGSNTDANLLVNFNNLNEPLSNLFKNKYKNLSSTFNRVANWGELDINLNKNHVLINGFLYAKHEEIKLNTLFKNINASSSQITEVIPDISSYYQSYCFDDNNQLESNYLNYLNATNQMISVKKQMQKFKGQSSFDKVISEVFDIIDDEFAKVIINNSTPEGNSYLIVKTKSKSKTLKIFENISGNKIEPTRFYQLDKQAKYPIYKNEVSKIFPTTLSIFSPNLPDGFFTFIDNYIIFSNTFKSLSEIIYANILNKTLEKNNYHQEFSDMFSYKDNMFIYCDISKVKSLISGKGSSELLNPDKSQEEALNQFYGIGIQITTANELLYMNACLKYLPGREREPETIWQSGLDSTIIGKPALVINHNTKEKEILVQDKSNMLYLISNSGRILWKKKLESAILSEIVQIDYYRNNKLQYIFNTANKIYLIDRNGNNVDKYPVTLAYNATNGIAVFDYDKNRNYRIFVACDNNQTYVYEKSGKRVTGWKAKATEGAVKQSIQHFRVQGKDYIAFSDDKRNYILNRRGKNRVDIKSDFITNPHSKFHLIVEGDTPYLTTTDSNGNLQKIDLTNGNCYQLELLNSKEPHFYLARNITTSSGIESILVSKEKVTMFSSEGKKLFQVDIKGHLVPIADTYQFSSNNIKIGVFDTQNNKIYLINNNGSIYKNFPLRGKSRFSIGFMNKSSSKFNLIVGGENNYLYNYIVE